MAETKATNWTFWTAIITAVVGPIVAFYFAKGNSDTNHAQSAKGYELVAQMVNQHEQRLDNIERLLQRIEQHTVAASQPASRPSITLGGPIIIPGGRVDPWVKTMVGKAPAKMAAPVFKTERTTVLVNPKYAPAPAKAPARAPARLEDVR